MVSHGGNDAEKDPPAKDFVRSQDSSLDVGSSRTYTMCALCAISAIKGADLQMLPASFRAMEADLYLTPYDLGILALCQWRARQRGRCGATSSTAGPPGCCFSS